MRLDRQGRLVLAGTAAITTACVFPAFLIGAMAVQVRDDLGFSASGTGVGIAAFFGAASLTSLVLGRTVERIGPRAGLRAAVVVSAASSFAIAVAARSLPVLGLLLAAGGSANALCQPAANLLIARHLPPDRQGFAFAVKQAAIPFSTLLAGVAVPALALTVGWRWGFVAAGLLALASALLVPEVGARPANRPAGWRIDRAGDAPGSVMVVLALAISFGAAAGGTLGAFLVSAAVDAGIGEGAAGLLLTLGSVVGIAVRLLAGLRADQRDGGHLRVVVLMLLGGAVAFGALATTAEVAYVVAGPLAFATAWAWPGLFNLAVVRANPASPAAATGITQTGTYIGAVAGPLLFGVIADRTSFATAWLVAAGFALAAAAGMAWGRARLRAHRRTIPAAVPT